MIVKIKNGYRRLSGAKLSLRAKSIKNGTAANADFPTLAAESVVLADIIKDYDEELEESESGDKRAIARRDAQADDLIDQLHTIGYMAMGVTTDAEKLIGAGFEITEGIRPSGPLVKPAAPRVKSTPNSGEMLSIGKGQVGQKQMYHEITEAPLTATSEWKRYEGNSRYTFKGYTSGKQYLIRICMSGVRDQFVQGDYIAFVCQ
jgi:hypothetical protein